MKLLNRKNAPEPPLDGAVADRLKSVAGRGKEETELYPIPQFRAELHQPQRIKRLFWTPDELLDIAC